VTERNNEGVLAEGYEAIEDACRALLRLRMQLVPYLYTAFHRYHDEGVPPFRALVMDYPEDPNVRGIEDQYLVGDRLLVAPLTAGMTERPVYLPAGDWHDFRTGERLPGGRTIAVAPPVTDIPLFVKNGSLLPLAEAGDHAGCPAALRLTVRVYGDGRLPIAVVEDDGRTYAYERGARNRLALTWDAQTRTGRATRHGDTDCPPYTIVAWDVV
jgi:alpha-D-xyloside xylohydrolase